MLNIELLRLLAESERLIDAGLVPWVLAPCPYGGLSRLAVSPSIMEELGLEQGQTISPIILDAISELSLELLRDKLDSIKQTVEDSLLDPDFDFRKEM